MLKPQRRLPKRSILSKKKIRQKVLEIYAMHTYNLLGTFQ